MQCNAFLGKNRSIVLRVFSSKQGERLRVQRGGSNGDFPRINKWLDKDPPDEEARPICFLLRMLDHSGLSFEGVVLVLRGAGPHPLAAELAEAPVS
jgi:hypothetical protein